MGKNILEKIKSFIKDPAKLPLFVLESGIFDNMADEKYLKIKFYLRTHQKLNLDNPKTFNEKLQWLKLHDKNPEYTKMVDKYEAKQYITDKIGEGHVIPTLGVWDRFDDIDFDKLPNMFVLKCTHDSGGLVICKDKSKLNKEKAKKKIEKCLKHNYYKSGREFPYRDVKPRIIAEEFLCDDTAKKLGKENVLYDYKFFCFDGEPKFMYMSQDKADDPRTDFFDMDYNRLPVRMRDPNSDVPPPKPECFEEMKEIAKKLSSGIKHVRIDFYYVDNKIYVGEITFYHCSGFARIRPDEWALKFGDYIKLD